VIYLECPECDGVLKIKKIPYRYRNQIYLGDFKAEVCKKCGSIYFVEDSFKEIVIIAKLQGIWGRESLIPQRIEISTSGRNISMIKPREFFSKIPSKIYINEMSESVD
jgi:YgiT-type zinc finger domain-containing protein